MQKHPFDDTRIASLLADIIKCMFKDGGESFKEGARYRCEIEFTVEDEYLVIGDNRVCRIKVTET